MRRSLWHLCAGLLVAAAAGCGKPEEPVAEMTLSPSEVELQSGTFVELSLRILPRSELGRGVSPTVFLHLVDEPGSVLRTFDHRLPGEFRRGHELTYKVRIYQSALAEPLVPGTYTLTAGLHDGASQRYPLLGAFPEVARLEYAVAKVLVPPASPSAPSVRYSSAWLPVEAGLDRQIVARRPLAGAGPGTLQVGPLKGPGEIFLRFGLPQPGSGRLERLAGESSSKVRLSSSCGSFQAELPGEAGADGSGVEIQVPVPPTSAPVECDLEIAPNFLMRTESPVEGRSIVLEILAWRAGASEAAEERDE